jgi:dTDP-4-amino-4,6-dideoxygalactose transaminase
MPIAKTACISDLYSRPYRLFNSARSALKAFLAALNFKSGEIILLPAYIGWSPREGSGVFDPVAELALSYEFYRLDGRLRLDLDHLEHCFQRKKVRVLFLIHYFGYVDPNYHDAVALARKHGALVVEDEAHALFTDWFGGACGRLGDAGIFSLHKMLPVQCGGMLVVPAKNEHLLTGIYGQSIDIRPPWSFDWHEIAIHRRRNAEQLANLLAPLADELDPLWGNPKPNEVPQTFPVLVKCASRDDLYTRLNAVGFGAVSLYHTLITQIQKEDFPDSHKVARNIINLPVHQDIHAADLIAMVEQLKNICLLQTRPLHRHNGFTASSVS